MNPPKDEAAIRKVTAEIKEITAMTTPKLHPAAVKAAGILVGAASLGWMGHSDYEEVINDAIDDHLKSEGWEELKEAAEGVYVPDPESRAVLIKALRRVRGGKP